MSANNAKVQAVIETTFNSAINKLAANEAGNCYSDLYVQVDAESATLKAVLAVLVTKKVFDNPCFLKPFSVSLTDEDFSVIEELLFLDDENLRLDDPLLKDLDADLDDFLAKLLSDVK